MAEHAWTFQGKLKSPHNLGSTAHVPHRRMAARAKPKPQRSFASQPKTCAQNVGVLIRLSDEHAIADTAFGVELFA